MVETQHAGRKRSPPDATRVAKRVARALADPPCALHCQEAHDTEPKEVQPLNAGFFLVQTMRHANVAATKVRAKRRGKVKGK